MLIIFHVKNISHSIRNTDQNNCKWKEFVEFLSTPPNFLSSYCMTLVPNVAYVYTFC